MRNKITIPGSILLEHINTSNLDNEIKKTYLRNFDNNSNYIIAKSDNQHTIQGYSRRCQLDSYLTARDKRLLNSLYCADYDCYINNCIYNNNRRKVKCVAITNFILV